MKASDAHKIRLEGNALFKTAVAQVNSHDPFQFRLLMEKAIYRYWDGRKVASTPEDLSSLDKNLRMCHFKIGEKFLAASGFSEDLLFHVKRALEFFDAARARVEKDRRCQSIEWFTDIESRLDAGAKLPWSSSREVRRYANYKSTRGVFVSYLVM
jgi:hypothetical protein